MVISLGPQTPSPVRKRQNQSEAHYSLGVKAETPSTNLRSVLVTSPKGGRLGPRQLNTVSANWSLLGYLKSTEVVVGFCGGFWVFCFSFSFFLFFFFFWLTIKKNLVAHILKN